MIRRVVWLLLLAMWLAPLRAAAQPAKPSAAQLAEARTLFRAGARAYDAGRFDVAVKAFDQAYELAPRVAIRFSAAQALRRLYTLDPEVEHLERALRYYQQYLAEVKEGRRVRDAAGAVSELQALLAKLRPAPALDENGEPVEGPPNAAASPAPAGAAATGTIQLDSATPRATATIAGRKPLTSLPKWVDLPPGNYQVTVTADGYQPMKREVRVIANRVTVVDAVLKAKPATLAIVGDAGTEVLVDGRLVGRTPIKPLRLSAGPHDVVMGRNGRTVCKKRVTLERGESHELEAEFAMTTQRGFSWGLFTAGAVSIATATVMFGVGRSYQNRATEITNRRDDEARALTLDEANEYNDLVNTSDNLQRVSTGAFVSGLGLAGLALTLFVFNSPDLYGAAAEDEATDDDAPKPDDERDDGLDELSVSALPMASPDARGGLTVGVTLSGRF